MSKSSGSGCETPTELLLPDATGGLLLLFSVEPNPRAGVSLPWQVKEFCPQIGRTPGCQHTKSRDAE